MKPQYIDVHSHLNFDDFDADRDQVLKRAHENGVWMMNVGVDKVSSKQAVELAEQNSNGVFATIGQHPTYDENFDEDYYLELAKSTKVKAVGECGLDYFHLSDETKSKQKDVFEKQIAFAKKIDRPLMLHIRDAYDDALDILKSHKDARGNVHFFAGDVVIAKKFLDLGFTLSFTGVITFTKDYDEVIKYVPLNMILSETDCPYVAPIPYRGKRNEPLYVKEVVRRIAEIRGLDLEITQGQIVENAIKNFGM